MMLPQINAMASTLTSGAAGSTRETTPGVNRFKKMPHATGKITTCRVEKQAPRVDLDELTSQQLREQGSECDSGEGGAGCHRDGEGDVGTGDEGHHVGGGASRAAGDQNQAHRKGSWKPEPDSDRPAGQGHDQKLGDHAGGDRCRTRSDPQKIGGRERHAHAQHDHREAADD